MVDRTIRCPRCKEMYTYEVGLPPECCPKCKEIEIEQGKELRELVLQNRGITAIELQQKAGVSVEAISKLMDSGILNVKEEKREDIILQKGKMHLILKAPKSNR